MATASPGTQVARSVSGALALPAAAVCAAAVAGIAAPSTIITRNR